MTDNTLDETIARKCQEILLREAGDIPIVSVSQKPIDLGKNVCVGEIGRNWTSLYKQVLAGIDAIDTPYIGIAEHDCLYTHEHLAWVPPRDDVFYYNYNCWLVQCGGNHPELNGMYSYWPKRFALSQLVCHKDLLCRATVEVLSLIERGLTIKKGMHWHGEPGIGVNANGDFVKAAIAAESGRPMQLQRYLKDYLTKYLCEGFQTELPNIDIRHDSNFTGPKRGKDRCYSLPYWGEFKTIMERAA